MSNAASRDAPPGNEVSHHLSRGLATKEPIEAHAGEDADRNRHGGEMRQLSVRVDEGDDDQGDDPAGDRGQTHLSRDDCRAAGAAMCVREVPSTAGTGGHGDGSANATITHRCARPERGVRV